MTKQVMSDIDMYCSVRNFSWLAVGQMYKRLHKRLTDKHVFLMRPVFPGPLSKSVPASSIMIIVRIL